MPPFRNPPQIEFERIANFRDMAGHRTRDGRRLKSGLLFRSGHLGRATNDDVEKLAALGLRQVYDFRTRTDIESEGADRLPAGTRHVQLPMPDPARGLDIRGLILGNPDKLVEAFGNGRAEAIMVREAGDIVRNRIEPYRQFMTSLCADGAFPALFHCSAGKDRAGWAGSVVLLALDVPVEEVVEQYLLSNHSVQKFRENATEEERSRWHDVLQPLLEVRPHYFESSMQAVREEWGDFSSYLREGLGISDAQRQMLQDQLLE